MGWGVGGGVGRAGRRAGVPAGSGKGSLRLEGDGVVVVGGGGRGADKKLAAERTLRVEGVSDAAALCLAALAPCTGGAARLASGHADGTIRVWEPAAGCCDCAHAPGPARVAEARVASVVL